LIVTGHNNFDKNNEVLKAVAQACAGENLLLNWVEQDNYRTIAGTAIAYGHSLVSQSPIDVNIGKQMNILLTNMDVKPEQIMMIRSLARQVTASKHISVMERIRLTALGGRTRCWLSRSLYRRGRKSPKPKKPRRREKEFPAWGDLGQTCRRMGTFDGGQSALRRRRCAYNVSSGGGDGDKAYHIQTDGRTGGNKFRVLRTRSKFRKKQERRNGSYRITDTKAAAKTIAKSADAIRVLAFARSTAPCAGQTDST